MRRAKKSKAIQEPTLGEVLTVMNERFSLVEARIDQRTGMLSDRMDGLDARMGDLQRTQTKMANQIGDIQDDLASALHATDNDGSAILNHEQRITHLEKLGGIKSTPPKHLTGLR